MGLATIIVVLIAVVGSLTVLPAVLALLGDRVDAGRLPLRASNGSGPRRWARVAAVVSSSPKAALVAAVCVLAALAVPLGGMHTADNGIDDLPPDLPVVQAAVAVERAFPGAPDDARIVVAGHGLDAARPGLRALGERARAVTGGTGEVVVRVAPDATTASITVPLPDHGDADATVRRLRADVAPRATGIAGVSEPALITGDAASGLDYSDRMATATPVVIGAVLFLGFLLLTLTFRAPLLAAGVMALNLLSIGAAYGVLTIVFQHTWAQHLIGFRTTGHIVAWIPLFMFVILFGLSMDYTILVLERIRERREAGRTPAQAAAEGVTATAGTITSAAVVMVAVFAIFATLGVIVFQQLGVGLAAAVLLDATVVRGIALPALVVALGERGWRVSPQEDARTSHGGWKDVGVESGAGIR